MTAQQVQNVGGEILVWLLGAGEVGSGNKVEVEVEVVGLVSYAGTGLCF